MQILAFLTNINDVHLYIASNDVFDTAAIEKFLLEQDGIINAVVWVKNSTILARITATESSTIDEYDIKNRCQSELGPELTPHIVVMERALRPAA